VSAWTSDRLALAVLGTLQDVLVHQRSRWAALFAHHHQYEGWWKAEFALALESWCWRMDLPEPTWVLSEVKPRDHGVGESKRSMDILVGRWLEDEQIVSRDHARVWLELKERGTWWGDPWKALCEEKRSVCADIDKWKDAPWQGVDVVVACQIISHDASAGSLETLPPDWREVLEEIDRKFPRLLPPRSVCCPSISSISGKPVDRFATIEFFTIWSANSAG
jgi:hypothetical protein